MKKLFLPLSHNDIKELKTGDCVLLNGKMLVARDEAHLFIKQLYDNNLPLPCSFDGETVFYMGPATNQRGEITAAGPTTSARMDAFTPLMLDLGVIAFVGKGKRADCVNEAIKNSGAVYFAAIGGAGALYASLITHAEIVAFEELGAEALRRIEVKDFPVVVSVI